jgi:hypothetical protein
LLLSPLDASGSTRIDISILLVCDIVTFFVSGVRSPKVFVNGCGHKSPATKRLSSIFKNILTAFITKI